MDMNGDFKISNSLIRLHGAQLHLVDRYAQQFSTGLPNALHEMVFDNCDFEDVIFYFAANITFRNCRFKRCRFVTNNTVGKPVVKFISGSIEIELGSIQDNQAVFDFTRGLSKLTLDNTSLSGKYENNAGYNLFHNFSEGEIEISNRSRINIERFRLGVSQSQQLMIIFGLSNGVGVKVEIDNADIKGVLLNLSSGTGVSNTIFKVKNSSLSKRQGDTDVASPIRAAADGTYDKVKLHVTTTSFTDDQAYYDANVTRITDGGGIVKTQFNTFSEFK